MHLPKLIVAKVYLKCMDNFGTVHETQIFGTSAELHLAFLQPGDAVRSVRYLLDAGNVA